MRARQISSTALAVLLLLLTMNCSKDPSVFGPSSGELEKSFATELPAYINVNSFDVQVSENVGDKVEPKFKSRFKATIKLMTDTFVESGREEGAIFIDQNSKSGEKKEIYGIALSTLSAGSWKTEFRFDNNPIPRMGQPRDFFSGKQVIIKGSSDEIAFRAERQRQREEAEHAVQQRREESEREAQRQREEAELTAQRQREADEAAKREKDAQLRAPIVSALAKRRPLTGEQCDDRFCFGAKTPFKIYFDTFNENEQSITGRLVYPTYNNEVDKFEGTLAGSTLTFTVKDWFKTAEGKLLAGVCTLSLVPSRKGRIEGKCLAGRREFAFGFNRE